MKGDDLVELAHTAQRAMRHFGNPRRAAKAMSETISRRISAPTLLRYCAILDFPPHAIAAYRHGNISNTLMMKLTTQPPEKQAALWDKLWREGRLIMADLQALRDEPQVLVRRLQATARKLKEQGVSEQRIKELIEQA